MILKCPSSLLNLSEAEKKEATLQEFIRSKIDSDPERISELSKNEKIIFTLEQLSMNINLDGLGLFFDEQGPYALYYEIIEALEFLRAYQMKATLEKAKVIILGDLKVTEENVDNFIDEAMEKVADTDDSPEHVDIINELCEEEVVDDFNQKLQNFTVKYFDVKGYSLG